MTYPGFLIDVPEALLRGCRYLPLTQTIPLPGGTVTLRSDAEQGELLFGQLARDEEPFAMCLASPERAQSGRLELARYGVLGLISAHERSAPDEFTTTLLGVGRVRRGEPYLLVDEALPRVDLSRHLDETLYEREALQQALTALTQEALGRLPEAFDVLKAAIEAILTMHRDPSLNLDGIINLIAQHRLDVLQRFIKTASISRRLVMAHSQLDALTRQRE